MQHAMDKDGSVEPWFLTEPRYGENLVIPLANETMLQWARKFVGGRVLVMDTTFGTNIKGYSLLALLAIDDSGSGLPVALALLRKEDESSFAFVLEALDKRLNPGAPLQHRHAADTTPHTAPVCRPAAVLMDDSNAEQAAAKCASSTKNDSAAFFVLEVPGLQSHCSLVNRITTRVKLCMNTCRLCRSVWPLARQGLCSYHVRKAWQQKLVQRVKGDKSAAFKGLEAGLVDVMYMPSQETETETRRAALRHLEAWYKRCACTLGRPTC